MSYARSAVGVAKAVAAVRGVAPDYDVLHSFAMRSHIEVAMAGRSTGTTPLQIGRRFCYTWSFAYTRERMRGERMKILATGAAGFIGSNVADLLIEDGHDVIIVDDVSTGRRDWLSGTSAFRAG